MRIFLLTHYFPPEINAPAQRAYDHARYWVELGHSVTIVTAVPSHPFGKVYAGYINDNQEEEVDGIRVIRLKTWLGANAGIVNRVKNYVSFPIAVRKNINSIGQMDVVVSTSPQFFCGLAGIFLQKYFRVPWVLEIRDIWPDSIVAVGLAKPSLITKAVGLIARWAYSKADAIVSVSPGFSDHFKEYGVAESKIVLIPNGINVNVAPKCSMISDFPALSSFEGKTIAAFVGTLGMAHGLDSLLEAAKLLESHDSIGILLVGSGARSDEIKSVLFENNCFNVLVLDQLSRDDILRLWSLVSISLVHLKRNDVFRSVIPTKLLEAMAMKKPVVLGVQGTASDILQMAKAGISVEPENSQEIANAILKLVCNPEQAEAAALNGREYVVKQFDRQKMAIRYIDLFNTLLNQEVEERENAS